LRRVGADDRQGLIRSMFGVDQCCIRARSAPIRQGL
jgi:hypothetical protein